MDDITMKNYEKELKRRMLIQEYNSGGIYLRVTLLSDGVHFEWKVEKSILWPDRIIEGTDGHGKLSIFRHNEPQDIDAYDKFRIFSSSKLEGEKIDYILGSDNVIYKYLVQYNDYQSSKMSLYGKFINLLKFDYRYPNKDYSQEYIKEKDKELEQKKLDKEYKAKEDIEKLEVSIAKREKLQKMKEDAASKRAEAKTEDEQSFYQDIIDKIDLEMRKFEI